MRYTEDDMGKLWQHVVDGAKEIMLGGQGNIGTFNEYMKSIKPVDIDCPICKTLQKEWDNKEDDIWDDK